MTTTVLTAHDLSCVRNERCLFSRVSFSVEAGTALQVLGPNGIGKTSLLKIIAGLLPLESGNIRWHNAEVPLYVGHKLGIKEQLTVRENCQFALQLAKTTAKNLGETLTLMGLHRYADELCAYLSAGQRQRVALARLWLVSRTVWILDEPFTALDQQASELLLQRIEQHTQTGGSVIFTSHQQLRNVMKSLKTLELTEYC
jgi:heme exporter protein A